ncbi:N-acetyl-gamma-glutamyl-phosphate reductase [Lactococcus raffinolactis]|uniref:N-acetyl-gamma-glutamyl-phosphate reductase n=1 Tax=Pseudolactococcus raffinolactis TaxID=1366 RepID=UPI00077C0BEE|nr:N-acetyl-gamma-glutamyl-phosphate reductase [Lactococcus raffinolactis]PCS11641.1 N-acetyl-gamma-glutamyl-phosphate reductase [Lactococcus raffinolactis]HBZ59763.1 N-acetyl-gamma-glutamyl-phosphate reductase [Lactococcus sp.]
MKKIAIIGISGYSGLELLRLLHSHPDAEIVNVYGTSNIGAKLTDLFPKLLNFPKYATLTIKTFSSDEIMTTADLVFFATPAGIAAELAADFIAADFPVVDLSGDFRLQNPAQYEKWYKKSAVHKNLLSKADYVLADFDRPTQAYVSNPGCYATATLLSLAPLYQANLIQLDSVIIDAKSGLSGAGKNLTDSSHYVNANENVSLYKLNQHQHIPEIFNKLISWNTNAKPIQFSTSLIPVNRGIFVSTYAKLAEGITFSDVVAAYHQTYDDKYFVRVLNDGLLPDLHSVVGTNFTDIGLGYNELTHTLTVVTVIDNLVKGAAGQAIQNMNHLFDFDEKAGLDLVPIL